MRPLRHDRIKLIIIFTLFRLTLLSSGNNNNLDGLVHCSSSYIDDYFLPTAKIALNKLQQSLTQTNNVVGGDNSNASKTPNRSIDPTNQVQGQPREATASQDQDQQYQQLPITTTGASSMVDTRPQPGPGDSPPSSEPNKNEFVNLEVRPDGRSDEPTLVDVSSRRNKPDDDDDSNNNDGRLSGSTESSSEDPSTPVIDASESSSLDSTASSEPVEAVSVNASEEPAVITTTSGSTTTTTTTSKSDEISNNKLEVNEKQQVVDESGQRSVKTSTDVDAVRETELEAIAAVDASIGFGDTYATTADACYDEYGNARYCEPEFENVAFERQVEVSSECGHPPSRFCTTNLNERNDQIRNCHICDAQHPKKRHPASYLTDMNIPSAPTCWVSAPISALGSSQPLQATPNSTATINTGTSTTTTSNSGDLQTGQSVQRDNVTLTINLDKRYEIAYISMQFCSLKPDSLAIWKSADFGKSWSPYQFYSSQCSRLYERQATSSPNSEGGQLNLETGQVEASCVNSSAAGASSPAGNKPLASGRVAFSTSLDEQQTGGNVSSGGGHSTPVDKTPALLDWMTATNIRIVLDRHQASWIQSSLAHSHHHLQQHQNQRFQQPLASANQSRSYTGSSQPITTSGPKPASGPAPGPDSTANKLPQALSLAAEAQPQPQPQQSQQQQLETSLTNPSDTYNYALSDLAIGGRCKCNGHASRCVHNADGQLQCDCQHNTDGPDCERCLPLHHDRPWQRATQANANPCQPCNCNGHSRKCRFDPELYLLSGKRSGGVCIDCKDNTTGRHCNYCKEGFTRDHTKPMSDQGACKLCDCHPVGSLGKVCNHLTGQCPCKEGVTGLECNKCAPGYQQSSSPTEPCIRLPENDINYEPVIEAAGGEVTEEQPPASSVSNQAASNDQDQPRLDGEEPAVAQLPSSGGTEDKLGPGMRPTKKQNSPTAITDNNRIDSVISSDELGPVFEQPAAPMSSEFDHLRPPSPHRPRQKQYRVSQQQHPHWQSGGGGGYPSTGRHTGGDYLGASGKHQQRIRPHHQSQSWAPQSQDDMEEADMMNRPHNHHQQQDEYEEAAGRQPTGYHRTVYYQPGKRLGSGYADFRKQSAGFDSMSMAPIRPVASLDHDQADNDQLAASGQDERLGGVNGYGGSQDGAIYAQPNGVDDANFNQIMRPRYNNNIGHRYQSHRQQQQHQQQQHQRRRLLPNDKPAQSNLNCAGCQTRKKLNSKQFCHLDYAIRGTVVGKRASSDWTRFEVEIQDIFKSPSSSSLLQAAPSQQVVASAGPALEPTSQKSSISYDLVDSSSRGFQSDEPSVAPNGELATNLNNNQTQTQADMNSIPAAELPIHRLRIGSVQTIWVPTEDVACRCPRLKLRTSYLLMGLVDTRDNSATSTQLDRHGVAMQWRTSLQEKLIKYQRIHSDGLC